MKSVRNTSATLRSYLKGSQIRNIDGKIIGKDGKPMMHVRHIETRKGEAIREEPVTVAKSLKDDIDRTFFEAWEDPNVGAMKITDGTYQDKNDAHESNENPNLASKRQGSFTDVLNSNKPSSKSKFRSLLNSEQVENADVVIQLATFTTAQQRYTNCLVGYFVGKNVAFPLVLEQGPWLIRNIPIILTKWSPNLALTKDKKTVMLDAFTSTMCVDPWDRMGYARALIEVSAKKELKQEVIMVVPEVEATFVYRPKISEPARTMETTSDDIDLFKLKNQFDSLRNQDDLLKENEVGETSGANAMKKDVNLNEDSESDVEEVYVENDSKGASTPSPDVNNV
ncbi:hypothetical protein Tco_0678055 [Tanacetum coccineum]|uniref:DUF4283 domain-containing protein n=1 Tax=Tanacetum coccineum TaxID=301880 RepID=A0ABQ4XDX6_9ASTR